MLVTELGMDIDVILMHDENALSEMLVTELGMVIEAREKQ